MIFFDGYSQVMTPVVIEPLHSHCTYSTKLYSILRLTMIGGISHSTGMSLIRSLRSRSIISPMRSRSIITIVPQAHVAYREFLGMNRTCLNPGIHWNIPVLHAVRHFPLSEVSWVLENMKAYTKDNVPVHASGTIFGKIVDAEKAAYEVSDVWSSVQAVGSSYARTIIGRFEYDKIISERNLLNEELMSIIGDSISNWGVQCTRFELQDFGPMNDSVARQLEKQMEAERARRENELNTQAKVRTSEGEKSSAILESEGALIAVENKAKGEAILITRRAEADAYERELQAAAWRKQIDVLGAALGSNDKAAQYLLEMQRLQHLQAVATGRNSKIYFVPPGGMLPGMDVIGGLREGGGGAVHNL